MDADGPNARRGAESENEASPSVNGEVASCCPECGRDTADTSIPKPAWNSWRRLLPISLLIAAFLFATAVSLPMVRAKYTRFGKTYNSQYNLLNGGLLFMVPPCEVTPDGLRAMADGTGSTEELRRLVDEIAALPFEIFRTKDPQPEFTICVGTPSIGVSRRATRGWGLALASTDNTLFYEQSLRESPGDEEFKQVTWELWSLWPSVSWESGSSNRWRTWQSSFDVPLAVLGLCLLALVVASRLGFRGRGRIAAVGLVLALIATSSTCSSRETHVSIHDKTTPLLPTGVPLDRIIGARESETKLRGLATELLAAIPESAPRDGICYLGSRIAVYVESEYVTYGPTYFYFGDLATVRIWHADEQGQPHGEATWEPEPFVRLMRAEPRFAITHGNTRRWLYLQTSPLLALLTLVSLFYAIPWALFRIAANRRHRRRLRLGLCLGCGYRLLTR